MSRDQKRVTEMALATEIAAVAADIKDRPPRRDHWGQPIAAPDIRVTHLALCRSALSEVQRIRPTD